MGPERKKVPIIACVVVALMVIAAIVAVLVSISILTSPVSKARHPRLRDWMSGLMGRWGSLSFPLEYQLMISMSPTGRRNYFYQKATARGGVNTFAEEATQCH